MKMKVLQDAEYSITFEIEGEQHTFPQLICWALLQDPSVEVAVYDMEHPLVGNPKVYVKSKGKKVKQALADALDVINKELSSLKKGISKMETKKK